MAVREKENLTYREKTNLNKSESHMKYYEDQRKGHHSFQILKEKGCQPRLLDSFRDEGEVEML